jgi:uncharacterized protein (DUF934 family)
LKEIDMPIIVTRDGATEASGTTEYITPEAIAGADGSQLAVALPNSVSPDTLAAHFERIATIRIDFPAMGDGRGFSQARRLRVLGFTGRLRGSGPLVSDQLRAAFRVGFDEIEVADKVAARQPASQWQVRHQGSYQDRLLV